MRHDENHSTDATRPAARVTLTQFLVTAGRKEIVRRALVTAAVVGTILAAINHGPQWIAGSMGMDRLLQIGLTYLVPYCVSTYAATMQELRRERRN